MFELANALMSDFMTDIVFSVNGENIPAHKLILYYRSPVFKTMFDGPMAPKSVDGEKPLIKIDDARISAEDFRTFLLFLYSGSVDINGDNAFSLINMAKMYDVASLIPLIETFLINNLTSENVVVVANSASFFPDSNISKETVDFIIKKSDILKSEAEFSELNADVLLEVLKCEEGNLICHPNNIGPNVKCLTCNKQASFPESQLFDMVLLWAKNQCKLQELEENPKNMKEILEPFLSWIRFPTMTVEYLTKVVYPWKLLDESTMLRIIVDAQNHATGRRSNESSFRKDQRKLYIKPELAYQMSKRFIPPERPAPRGFFYNRPHVRVFEEDEREIYDDDADFDVDDGWE